MEQLSSRPSAFISFNDTDCMRSLEGPDHAPNIILKFENSHLVEPNWQGLPYIQFHFSQTYQLLIPDGVANAVVVISPSRRCILPQRVRFIFIASATLNIRL